VERPGQPVKFLLKLPGEPRQGIYWCSVYPRSSAILGGRCFPKRVR
jgi:hypothetical protein